MGSRECSGQSSNRYDESNNNCISVSDRLIQSKRLLVTAPIYYVNGRPHLGHLYSSVAVDIIARFARIQGQHAFTSFGTDEHGQKVASAAASLGKTPASFVDEAYLPFEEMLRCAEIDYNSFIRTTDEMHKKVAQSLWQEMSELFYEGHYEGYYSKVDEAYYKEEEIVDGKSIHTGSSVEWMQEPCIFFKLSALQEKLTEHYRQNPDVIKPKTRYSEVMGMLAAPLPDLAVSRSRFDWGIPVPGHDGQVMYVWIDALANYLTAIGYPRNDDYKQWWSSSVHVIGKDILKFHAIYWPAMLMAAGIEPPSRIFAHGWWNVDAQKMSKSLGNVVDPFLLLSEYGVDQVRYFMFREIPFGNDGTFSNDALQNVVKAELVNEFGNLVQRVMVFCYNKYGSTVECKAHSEDILNLWDSALHESIKCMQEQDISGYLKSARSAVVATNRYIDSVKPWACDPEHARHVMGILCLCVQRMAILYSPIIPQKCTEVGNMIGLSHPAIDPHWHKNYPFPLKRPNPLFMR